MLKSEMYHQTYQNKHQQQLSLLKFKRDQLMMDPEVSLDQIRDLQEKIQTLQNMVNKN